jgi:FKBP-type peptidyl-prolyl cis-trans isomerase SlyD
MQVTSGAVVSIFYTLTDSDGVIVDSNVGRAPLVYLHGYDNLIPGLERELEGMSPGDRAKVSVLPVDGYGEFDQEAVFEVSRDEFPDELPMEVGMQFCAETPSGEMTITVTEVKETSVVVDANHPLAGKTLHFDVEVVDTRQGSEDELRLGQAVA